MFRFRPRISISLTGGLGNQLYQFYAGQFFATKLNAKLKYTQNPLPKNHYQENSNIQSFVIENRIRPDFIFSFVPKLITRVYKGLMRRSSILAAASNFIGGIYFEKKFEPETELTEISKSLSRSIFRKKSIKGYYQDFGYFLAINSATELVLKSPSTWYTTITKEVIVEKPVIIHLRLGDYLEQPTIWGVLDREYYLNGLNHIKSEMNFDKVWVFSDNFDAAKFILKGIEDFDLKFIDSSEGRDPAEVLKLMSMGIAQVTSNSTFSLWAAIISSSSRFTIIPNPVFRNMQGQARGLPNDWVKVEASWADNSRVREIINSSKIPN
jgi:hypothetical protein